MDFSRPNAEIGRKMANGRLLFLALSYCKVVFQAVFVSSEAIVFLIDPYLLLGTNIPNDYMYMAICSNSVIVAGL